MNSCAQSAPASKIALSLVLGFGAGDVPAESVSRGQLFGSIVLTSDYVDRGVSQSNGRAAVQGDVGWRHASGLFGSLWASSVNFDDGGEGTLELNYVVGFEREHRNVTLSADLAYIDYPGADAGLKYDLVELSTAIESELGNYVLSAAAILSPEHAGNSGTALYTVAELARRLSGRTSLSAHVGRQSFEREEIAGPDYNDWGVVFDWSYERVLVALAYTDTDARAVCRSVCDARIIASVRVSLE